MPNAELIERDGFLFVLDPWTNHFSQPIAYRTAWPTGVISRDFAWAIGLPVTPVGDGLYRLPEGMLIALENRGETAPEAQYCEERHIPRPAWCHEYRNGRWCK